MSPISRGMRRPDVTRSSARRRIACVAGTTRPGTRCEIAVFIEHEPGHPLGDHVGMVRAQLADDHAAHRVARRGSRRAGRAARAPMRGRAPRPRGRRPRCRPRSGRGPARRSAITRNRSASRCMSGAHTSAWRVTPCTSTTGRPSPDLEHVGRAAVGGEQVVADHAVGQLVQRIEIGIGGVADARRRRVVGGPAHRDGDPGDAEPDRDLGSRLHAATLPRTRRRVARDRSDDSGLRAHPLRQRGRHGATALAHALDPDPRHARNPTPR